MRGYIFLWDWPFQHGFGFRVSFLINLFSISFPILLHKILCHYKGAVDKENEIILHLLYISKAMYVAWVILHREMICRIPKKRKKERKGIRIISKGIA